MRLKRYGTLQNLNHSSYSDNLKVTYFILTIETSVKSNLEKFVADKYKWEGPFLYQTSTDPHSKPSIMTSPIHKTLITKCVLFDMDGTLIDTTPLVEKHWRSFADEHGLDAEKVNDNSFSLAYESR